MRSTKIYVGNLPETAESAELQALFEKYGEVKECDIVRNYGFVHMASDEEAKAAIIALNNMDFMGQKISVEMSRSQVRKRPGMGGKGQCYRCGRNGHWSKECPRNPAGRGGGAGGGPSPLTYPSLYGAERFPRFSMEHAYSMDRSFAEQRFSERMRPYPDPYERRPISTPEDNYMYYRRPYDAYPYARRSPPAPQPAVSRYDFTQDPTFTSGQLTPSARRAPVF